MKKIFLLATVVCLFLLGNVAWASNIYPQHLGGNSNFILVDGHMGTAWYLDRSSLYVEKYAPPQYIIVANVCTVNNADRGNTTISKVQPYRFFYNWDLRQMYIDRNGNSSWVYLKPLGSWAESGVSMPAGEMAFYLAYGLKFYGSQKWYDSYLKGYYSAFEPSFYEIN